MPEQVTLWEAVDLAHNLNAELTRVAKEQMPLPQESRRVFNAMADAAGWDLSAVASEAGVDLANATAADEWRISQALDNKIAERRA